MVRVRVVRIRVRVMEVRVRGLGRLAGSSINFTSS